MFDEATVDELLAELLTGEAAGRGEALAQLMAAATIINRDWEQVLAGKPFTAVAVERARLQKWIERLSAKADEYAETLHASGVSVTVGWPAGVGITLSWSD
jgi:hypothetical protein